jgi:hypothetical protein
MKRDGLGSFPFMIQAHLLTVANCALHICARYYNNVCPKKDRDFLSSILYGLLILDVVLEV